MAAARDLGVWTPAYLALVLLLGGAGAGYPLLECVEELGALALLAACLARSRPPLPPLGRAMVALWLFCLAVPAVQLVPLPPMVWAALPGRALAVEIGRLAGQQALWRPVTLLPERTIQALLALLPPGAMLVATLRLSSADRWRLVAVVVAYGLGGAMLGALQFASGSGEGVTPFATDHRGYAVGLFVNRNHQATFLLVAMILGGALGARAAHRRGWTARLLALGYALPLALAAVATTSRMGTVLTPFALLVTVWLLFGDRITWRTSASAAAVAAMLAVVGLSSGSVRDTLARFSVVEDERVLFWRDSAEAIRRSFPVGTGVGGFEPAHRPVERLEHVGTDLPNHAHDDYLELTMDAGAAAIGGLAALAVVVACAMRRVARLPRRSDERLLGGAGLTAIAVMLAHSLVDYPLRMTAMAALFALCGALLAPAAAVSIGGRVRRRLPALSWSAVAIATLLSVAAGLAAHVARRGDDVAARRWAPWSSSAASRLATADLLTGRMAAATALSREALATAPTDAAAVRTLGLADTVRDPTRAAALMRAAAALGWRDRLTQYWSMERGFETGDAATALARTDALLRQGVLTDALFAMLHRAVRDPAIRSAAADRLSAGPAWAAAYLDDVDRLPRDPLLDHAGLLALVARRSPALARAGIARTADKLVDQGDAEAAEALSGAIEPFRPLRDGDFEQIAGRAGTAAGPFGWKLASPVATRVTIDMADDPRRGAALHVRSPGVATGMVAAQLVHLPPGRSTLVFSAAAVPATSPLPFEWRVACHGLRVATPLPLHGPIARQGGWATYASTIGVSPRGCRFQDLQLWSTASATSDFRIGRVAVAP